VVIDNKTGAGGTIAMAELARAPADGHTLGVIAQGLLVYNLGLYKTRATTRSRTWSSCRSTSRWPTS
jgi:tripartite-type tricarboxylate transporter receptor subunit TctC